MNDLRVVLDTNVVVSATLLPGSVPRRALDKGLDQGSILISIPVLLEIAEVLTREKFERYVTESERLRFLVALLKETELVEITEQIDVCRDPKDNKFLELAICGEADFIITGDDDLLDLDPFRGVRIITPRDFLEASTQPPPPSPH